MRQAFPATIAGIPTLTATPDDSAAPLPVVFWCHGFRADALAHAAQLERCAAAGFLAVGIDAIEHGARQRGDLMERAANTPGGAFAVMLDLVEQSARELPQLVDGLAKVYDIDRARISLVGVSMGAFHAYHAIATGAPLRAVVALLGAPEWSDARSPHRSLSAFRDVALLSITAERDQHVPPGPARRMHVDLALRFPTSAFRYYELAGAGHLTSGESWDEAMQETLQWLEQHG